MTKSKNGSVCIIGAPLSHGQTMQGVDQAPSELRKSGLCSIIRKLGWELHDFGDISFQDKGATHHINPFLGRPIHRSDHSLEYTESEITNSRLLGKCCGQIAETVSDAAEKGHFVLTIGGDHSVAAGTISGLLTVHPDLIVVWVDAHGDINIPEISPSHSYHGMPVAHLLGLFRKRAPGFEWINHIPNLHPDNFAFIGLRDIDYYERDIINTSGVHAYSMKDVDHLGIATVVRQALQEIDPTHKRPIHLSFDIDGCDPSIAPGTGTKARGGLSYREAHYICESLHETGRLVSMDVVEVNPDIDVPDEVFHGDDFAISENSTKTVRLGLELISSALGKVIL